ncbi:MAG: DUF2914 domain-containing protein [Deltaproteobacteria bacterium]|nr:DUF2914 domain-containing protein [Deltaproteobacteria bacterium]
MQLLTRLFAGAMTLLILTTPASALDTPHRESLRIGNTALCRGVIDRTPVEPGDIFPADVKELYCFTQVLGAPGETEISHIWFYRDRKVSRIFLPVKSTNWRTYSKKTIPQGASGEWKVEIRSQNGDLLKQIYFAIH